MDEPFTARMKDVAALARVSIGTVSNVINRPEAVSPSTRQRVLAAIEELGFVRNDSARRLRGGHGSTLAYLTLDTGNPFFTDVARGIREEAEQHGLSVFLGDIGKDPHRQTTYLDLLERQRAEGVLVTPADDHDTRLRVLPQRGIPIVLVDRQLGEGFCSVTVDDVTGGDLAATHLIDLGHRRLGFVGGSAGVRQIGDRMTGVRNALERAGLDPSDLVLLPSEDLDVNGGRRGGERLAGLPGDRRPSGVVCGNDLVALGLLQQALRLGMRVPEDIAIVGYDDIEFAEAAMVPLTSVAQPRHLLGKTAAALLLAEMEHDPGHRHRQVVFQPELVVRASSRRHL
ncbi:LacI family DNA-binding transcriptional regulator [Lentzea sp. NPDC058450]|uniref:LacI family DNA-binding transcriptional regulator n=1 Tax=Lentzea sp. NPDC058450 TaxID=3346505 RepID=UPI00364AEE07